MPAMTSLSNPDAFKETQKKFPRVQAAYAEQESNMHQLLQKHGLVVKGLQLYLQAFKSEQVLELWARNASDAPFQLIKTFPICANSGTTGPKRKEGDKQVPEGFYHINRFNPLSKFHLSVGLNYPNPSDLILGDPENPGSDIFIHGGCTTVGCLPITDAWMQALYLFCIESKNAGHEIPVTIFPARLTDENHTELIATHQAQPAWLNLWAGLKKSHDLFQLHRQPPLIRFLKNGEHQISVLPKSQKK